MGVDNSPRRILQDIEEALCPEVGVVTDYELCFREKLKGTGNWIYSEPLYQQWEEGTEQLLWLCGPPGSGKSHLAGQLIRHLLDSSTPVAYFFCRDNIPSRRLISNVLKTSAWQLSRIDIEYAKDIHEICVHRERLQELLVPDLWEELFVKTLGRKPAFLIIDGVDEAYTEDVDTLLEALAKYNENSYLRVLLIGRPEVGEQIMRKFGQDLPSIHITEEKNREDINKYIRHQLDCSRNLREISPKFREELIGRLSNASTGMFLWANLMVAELSSKSTEEEIRECLESLPKGLTEAYIRTLYRYSKVLNSYSINNLNKLLAWVLCATRPLSLYELQRVLEMDPSIGKAIDIEDEVNKHYSSFLTVSNLNGSDETGGHLDDPSKEKSLSRDKLSTYYLENHGLKLCHASLGDFFRARNDMIYAIGTTGTRANVWLTIACLDIITPKTNPRPSRFIWPELFEYATESWYKHFIEIDIALVSKEDKTTIANVLHTYFKDGKNATRYIDTWRQDLLPFVIDVGLFAKMKVWLQDIDVLDGVSEETRTWIENICSVETAENLLKPVVIECSKCWIKEVHEDYFQSFCVTYCYIHEFYKEARKGITHANFHGKNMIPKLCADASVEEIYEAARYSGLEEDAEWYTAVGIMLGRYKYCTEALEAFKAALVKNDTYYDAMHEIGLHYHCPDGNASKEDLTEALIWYRKAFQTLRQTKPDEVDLASRYLHDVAMIEQLLGLQSESKETCRLAMELKPNDSTTTYQYIRLLTDDEFMVKVLELDAEKPGRFQRYFRRIEESSFGQMVHKMSTDMVTGSTRDEFGHRFLAACLSTGRKEFYVKSMQRLIGDYMAYYSKKKRSEEKIRFGRHDLSVDWARLQLAYFYLYVEGDKEKTQRYLEEILEGTLEPAGGTRITIHQEEAFVTMSLIHFEAKEISKLEKISAEHELVRERHLHRDLKSWLRVLIANAYRITGQMEPAKSIAEQELVALADILTKLRQKPHDDENQYQYESVMGSIYRALFAAANGKQYDPNVLAAYYISSSPSASDEESGDLSILRDKYLKMLNCAGRCYKPWEHGDDIHGDSPNAPKCSSGYYECLYCVDPGSISGSVRYCKDCFALLKEGKLEWNVCRKDHVLFERVQGNISRTDDGKITCANSGVEVDEEEWVKMFLERWGSK